MIYRAEVKLEKRDGGFVNHFNNQDDMRNWINLVREDAHGQVKIWQDKNSNSVIRFNSENPDKVIKF